MNRLNAKSNRTYSEPLARVRIITLFGFIALATVELRLKDLSGWKILHVAHKIPFGYLTS
jgi:hypothetical protein